MLRNSTLLFFLVAGTLMGQQYEADTVEIDMMILEDAVVIDNWTNEHSIQSSINENTLELQLKKLDGISLISRGTFGQEISYRGQTDGRVQVKLGGMRIYSACTDRMDPSTSYIVANNLKTAELASACKTSCENNGIAGSVNLEMKGPTFDTKQPWHIGLVQEYMSNTNGTNTAFFVENSSSKIAWRLNGAYTQNANYKAGGGVVVNHSQNQKQNWAFNSVYRLKNSQFIKLDFIYDLAQDVGYPALPMDVSQARAVIGGITYSSANDLGPFSRFEVKVYHNDIYHEMDDTQRDDTYMHMDMPGWSRTSGVVLNGYDWKKGKHAVEATAEYYTNFRSAEMTMYPNNDTEPLMFMYTWPDARLNAVALGISDHWKFEKSHINTTLRVDAEHSMIKESFGIKQWEGMGYDMSSPRKFVSTQLSTSFTRMMKKKQSASIAASFGQRAPTTSELYGFYLFNSADGYDYLGNPDLEAEKLLSLELSYDKKDTKYALRATVFVQQYFDYIFGLNTNYDAMTWGAKGVREYHNVPNAIYYGAELNGHYTMNEHWLVSAKANYVRATEGSMNLPLIPPLQGQARIGYMLKKFNAGVQTRMAAEQNKYNADYGDQYTPGYALIDLSVGVKQQLKKVAMSLDVACNNVFDTYYRDHLNWGGIPSLGRNIILSLKVEY